jgi:hypothetical protein
MSNIMENDTGQPGNIQPKPTEQPPQIVSPVVSPQGITPPPAPIQPTPSPVPQPPIAQNNPPYSSAPVNNPSAGLPPVPPVEQLTPLPIMPQPSSTNGKPKLLLITLGFFVIFLLGASAFALSALHHKSVPAKTHTNSTASGTTSNATNNSTHATTSTAPASNVFSCSSESCFNSYFQKCSPATFATNVGGVGVKYQIYSKKGDSCSMMFEYTANPNPAWVNQPMTCDFDNLHPLSKSVSLVVSNLIGKQNAYNCSGPLVAILQSQ